MSSRFRPTNHRGVRPPDKEKNDVFTDYLVAPDVVAAARNFIRSQGHGCVVSIDELLEELSDKLGDGFPVSPDMLKLVDLIMTLWDDPRVDQVPGTGLIEFAWNGEPNQSYARGRRFVEHPLETICYICPVELGGES